MGFLARLERAVQERLEPSAGLDHPYEAALALWRLLSGHPRPCGWCPNRLSTPVPLDPATFAGLEGHLSEREFHLAAPLHQVIGPLGVGYAWPDRPLAAALVEVLDGASRGKLALINGRVVIGRADDCGLRLGDPSVSRHHCSVQGDLALEDLGSRQGVWVDGQRVDRAQLRDGQPFTLGGQTLRAVRLG